MTHAKLGSVPLAEFTGIIAVSWDSPLMPVKSMKISVPFLTDITEHFGFLAVPESH